MPSYCVNRNAQNDGYHEVHETSPTACRYLPDFLNQDQLGWHPSCHRAGETARIRGYILVDGCYYCCRPCHNR